MSVVLVYAMYTYALRMGVITRVCTFPLSTQVVTVTYNPQNEQDMNL